MLMSSDGPWRSHAYGSSGYGCLVVSGKSYSVEENVRLRARARELLLGRFGDNRTAMAKALEVSQATVSNFLSGKSGAGRTLATAIARELGISHDALVVGDASAAGTESVRFGDLPGWQEAVETVLTSSPYRGRLPEAAVRGTCEFKGVTVPSVIDARTVFNYARAWWEGLSDEEQSKAIHAQAFAEMKAEDRQAAALLKRGQLRDEVQEIRLKKGH